MRNMVVVSLNNKPCLQKKEKTTFFFLQGIKNKTLQICNKTQKILPLRLQPSHMIFGLLII